MASVAPSPWIVAHRGARREAPENSAAAFDRALAHGVQGIELDVRMSRDGVPVIVHDETLFRSHRRRRKIRETAFAELKVLDWGGWFSAEFSGEPLMTLDEVLRRYAGRTRLMVEIKSGLTDRVDGYHHALTRTVVRAICDTLSDASLERLYLLAFDPEVLVLAHDMAPHLKMVLNLPESRPMFGAAIELLCRNPSDWAYLWAICANTSRLTTDRVAAAHGLGKRVMTYSCNTRSHFKRMAAMGVDVIMTDDPRAVVTPLG